MKKLLIGLLVLLLVLVGCERNEDDCDVYEASCVEVCGGDVVAPVEPALEQSPEEIVFQSLVAHPTILEQLMIPGQEFMLRLDVPSEPELQLLQYNFWYDFDLMAVEVDGGPGMHWRNFSLSVGSIGRLEIFYYAAGLQFDYQQMGLRIPEYLWLAYQLLSEAELNQFRNLITE